MPPLVLHKTAAMAEAAPPVEDPIGHDGDNGDDLDIAVTSSTRAQAQAARLRWMVDEYLDFVARVLRNAGTPPADIDDEVQRTFIVAARRLNDVRPGAEKGFLFRIALNLAAHVRRSLARRREVLSEETPERIETIATPEHLTDQKRMRELLDRVLEQMDVDLRQVFVLYEFEEMNMSEIADVLGIPRGTVASRLRRAREVFRGRLSVLEVER